MTNFNDCVTEDDRDDKALDAPNGNPEHPSWKTEDGFQVNNALDACNAYQEDHSSWKTEENSFQFEYGANDKQASVAEDVQNIIEQAVGPGAHIAYSDPTAMHALIRNGCASQMPNGCPLSPPGVFSPAPVSPPVMMPFMMMMPVMPGQQAPAAKPTAFELPPPCQGVSNTSSGRTTVMWRNIPNNYQRDDLLDLMNAEGFAGSYDFFYAPVDFTKYAMLGYAFANFVCTEEAERFMDHFRGFDKWSLASSKKSELSFSNTQGLEKHIERYRNSPVMHPDVDEIWRPVLFKNGARVPFPPCTKMPKAPLLQDCRQRGA